METTPLPRAAVAALVLVVTGSNSACAPRVPTSGPEGRAPIPRETFWAGLSAPASRAEARGVLAMRPPLTERVLVPGGSFVMGATALDLKRAALSCQRELLGALCDEEGLRAIFVAEAPAHDVTLSPYAIDRTEVSVGAYTRCVDAGACPPPETERHDPRFDAPDLPATNVDWSAAVAFCTWNGGRLPTEAEWEFAARGPEGRTYPWGNVYSPYLCNHGAFARDATDATDGFAGLAPVGSFPDGATPLGILDLAGNAGEWVADYYDTDPQGFGYDASSQVDPKGKKFGVAHVVRGGSFADGAAWQRGTARAKSLGASPTVGFRCAADVW